jgi:hypothetical protein
MYTWRVSNSQINGGGGGGENNPERRASFVHFGVFERIWLQKYLKGSKVKRTTASPNPMDGRWFKQPPAGGVGAVLCLVCFILLTVVLQAKDGDRPSFCSVSCYSNSDLASALTMI